MPGTLWDGIRTPTALERTLAKLRDDGRCAMSPAGPAGDLAAFAPDDETTESRAVTDRLLSPLFAGGGDEGILVE